MLLILNPPMVGLWIRLLKVPHRLLYPAILLFCCIGVYSVNSQVFDIFLAAGSATNRSGTTAPSRVATFDMIRQTTLPLPRREVARDERHNA
jgi:hypothetical protein